MKHILLPRDKLGDLRFEGELIAKAASQDPATATRWTEIYLYRTKSGKFVAHQIGKSLVSGERDYFGAQVCPTEVELVKYLGSGWLARKIYEQVGISLAEEVA